MEFDLSLIEMINKAGIFVYPIILCSIVALAIFLEKIWVLRRKNIIPDAFLTHLYKLLSQNKLDEANIYSQTNDSSIARVAITAIENADKSKEGLREDIEEIGRREAFDLGKFTEGLGAVSNVSTLLGLLGTISGMIKIFSVIADQPIVNPPELAGGISEALYTTAFGLLVAIPAFLGYKYIIGRTDELVSLLEEESRKVLELIISAKEKEPADKDETGNIFG